MGELFDCLEFENFSILEEIPWLSMIPTNFVPNSEKKEITVKHDGGIVKIGTA